MNFRSGIVQTLTGQVWKVIIFMLIFIFIIALAIWLVAQALVRYQAPAAMSYDEPVVTAANSVLCPGETLHWTQITTVRFAPVVMRETMAVWSYTANEFAVRGVVAALMPYTENITRVQTLDWLVPELPDGRYELRIATTAEGRQAAIYVVPFVIRFACKHEGK